MLRNFVAVVGILILGGGQLQARDDLSFIGLDSEGKEKQVNASANNSHRALVSLLDEGTKQSLDSLSQVPTNSRGQYNMRRVYVGLLIGGRIGLGPLIQAQATPGFYLIFDREVSHE